MTNPQNNLNLAAALQPLVQPTANSPESSSGTDDSHAVPNCQSLSDLLAMKEPQPLVAQNSPENGSTPALLQFALAPIQSFKDRAGGKPRNGKIAHLPQLERDMVCRMLANNIPYDRIVDALQERGFQATERNISNWKTRGGYKEWRAAQESALELRTFQDNLVEFLRRHDADELPEVGLQAAATSLSALMLRPDLMREIASDPEKYSKLIEMQCRLAREIHALQKDRNLAATPFNPERTKRKEAHDVDRIRGICSGEVGKSAKDPEVPHRNFIPRNLPPALPSLTRSPEDTARFLESLVARTPKPSASSPKPSAS
jgi:hypothetical protein